MPGASLRTLNPENSTALPGAPGGRRVPDQARIEQPAGAAIRASRAGAEAVRTQRTVFALILRTRRPRGSSLPKPAPRGQEQADGTPNPSNAHPALERASAYGTPKARCPNARTLRRAGPLPSAHRRADSHRLTCCAHLPGCHCSEKTGQVALSHFHDEETDAQGGAGTPPLTSPARMEIWSVLFVLQPCRRSAKPRPHREEAALSFRCPQAPALAEMPLSSGD